MTKNLIDRFVAGIQSATRENYFDTKARGLVLRVSPRAKVWYFTYRNGGPTQWLRIGEYPAVSLAEARTAALDHRHAHRRRRQGPGRRTTHARAGAEPPWRRVHLRGLRADVSSRFRRAASARGRTTRRRSTSISCRPGGRCRCADITRTHVHELLDTVAGKGLTMGVNRAAGAHLADLHGRARPRADRRASGGAADQALRGNSQHAHAHAMTSSARCGPASTRTPAPRPTPSGLRLLLGQRGEETAGMRWSEVDLDAALWSCRRRARRTSAPHVVPLPPTALALLTRRRAERAGRRAAVFPALTLTATRTRRSA